MGASGEPELKPISVMGISGAGSWTSVAAPERIDGGTDWVGEPPSSFALPGPGSPRPPPHATATVANAVQAMPRAVLLPYSVIRSAPWYLPVASREAMVV